MEQLRTPTNEALASVIDIDAGDGVRPITYAKAIALADQYIAQGRTGKAGKVIRQLLTYFPYDVVPKAQELQLNVNIRNHANVLKIADEILPQMRHSSIVVALCMRGYRQAGRSDTALALARTTTDEFPDDEVVQNEIGLSFLSCGDKANAVAAFNRSISINPGFIPPYLDRARLCAGNLSREEIGAMTELFEHSSLLHEDRIMLGFAVAWAYEGVDAEKHFEYLNRANSAIAIDRPWDEKFLRNQIDEIKTQFGAKINDAVKNAKIEDLAPIFVIGIPRSGTSLIEQILSSHDMVTGCGETGALGKALSENARNNGAPIPNRNRPDDNNLGPSFHTIDHNYRENLTAFDIDTPFFTDKSIGNDRWIGLILMMYPNAKIVHCIRHPLDACLSMYQLHLTGQEFTYNLRWIAKYIQLHTELMSHWKGLFGDRIHTVQYEALIKDQENQTAELLKSCSLPWRDACLNFFDQSRIARTASNYQVKQPLYNSSVGRWRPYAEHLKDAADILGIDISE